jgi:hypothetical protein
MRNLNSQLNKYDSKGTEIINRTMPRQAASKVKLHRLRQLAAGRGWRRAAGQSNELLSMELVGLVWQGLRRSARDLLESDGRVSQKQNWEVIPYDVDSFNTVNM